MSEKTDLEGLVGAMAGVSSPLKTSFFAAASRLLGGIVANPAAWLRRPAQAVEDTTNARQIVSHGLAAALIEQAKNDPAVMQAVSEAYMPTAVRKYANRVAVVQKAAIELEALSTDPSRARIPPPDWANAHERYSEDASSDELQLLFAKILAGEVASPGSYSVAAMRIVSELSQSRALDFEWAWARSVGDGIWKSPEFNRGEAWMKVTRLRDVGLISPVDSGIHETPFKPLEPLGGQDLYVVAAPADLSLTVFRSKPLGHIVSMYNFTQVGLEIGSLLQRPDYRENLRNMAEGLRVPGVERISILATNKPEEVVWRRSE